MVTNNAVNNAPTLTGDSGTATLASGTITVKAGTSAQHSGSSVSLSGSSSTLTLNLSDSHTNILMGDFSGNATVSGSLNVGLGVSTLASLTSGTKNCAYGGGAAGSLQSGSFGCYMGHLAGSNYTTSESSNIIIGYQNRGTVGESNVIRLGSQGTGDGQQNQCYIAGIQGVTVSNPTLVTQNSSTNQMGTVPYTAFTTYSPTLAFGGGSTGITYSTRNGGYFQVGSLVWFYIDLHLSSKGSSTGNATITLPLTVNASVGSIDYLWYAVLGSFAAGTTYCIAETAGSGTTLALYQVNGSTGSASNITNSTFGGTDFLRISGTYLV
jgi:hypothetical protein